MTRTGKRATHKTKFRNARAPRRRSLPRLTKTYVRERLLGWPDKACRSHPAFGPKRTCSVDSLRRLGKVSAAGRCTFSAIELVVCLDNTQLLSRRLLIDIATMAGR